MQQLKAQRIWFLWRKEIKDGRINKIPFAARGGPTGTNEKYRHTWITYEEAVAAAEKVGAAGVGFVIPEGYFFLDIDHAALDDPRVQTMLSRFDSYAEYSVSGNGLHIYGRVDLSKLPITRDKNGKPRLDKQFYMKNPNITVIPATINPVTRLPKESKQLRRVAAYARVSTDSEEQLTSYEAQVDYYTRYIQGRPDWEFVGVYTDEGISATNTKRREGFNRMVQDALDGKIDLIVTKSVSRFARNTVDSLTTVRKLKDVGVEVYFEKENIWTLDSKGELLITIMSSLAQEESRSISENVTWGQRKRFADGKVSIPYGHFLGYRKGANGLPEIVPEEAVIVRTIYQMFIEGQSTNAIARHLTQQGIPTPAKKTVWQKATVESILRNEKYKGAALLQKSFTVDFLQKKTKANEGEVPQYYVEHSHEAIIAPAEWDKVQLELARRKNNPRYTVCNSPFAGKIICGDCGEIFGSKVWHSTSKYRRTIWRCNAKYENGDPCNTPHLYEDDLKQHFIAALSQLLPDRTALLEDGRLILKELLDTATLDADQTKTLQEMDVVAGMIRQMVNENANQATDQAAYADRYNSLVERYEKLQAEYDALLQQKERRQIQAEAVGGCLKALEELDLLDISFSDGLWNTVVDHVTVYADGRLMFHFKNGTEMEVKICKG